jgi:hypothetical protein
VILVIGQSPDAQAARTPRYKTRSVTAEAALAN